MLKFFPVYLSLFLLISCNSDTGKNQNSGAEIGRKNAGKSKRPDAFTLQQFELRPGSAGLIKVGMLTDSLKKLVPAENLTATKRELEGEAYTAYELRNPKTGNQLLLLAEENCAKKTCKIFRLRIFSPKFKTKEGIRVGSTFGELQKTYPLSFIGIGETDFVAVSDQQKMSFALDIAGFPPKELYKIKAADIPQETPITSIMLYKLDI